MKLPIYDNTKTLGANVKELFKFVNYNYREMTMGRVPMTTDRLVQDEQEILQAQANTVEAVIDEYNALIEFDEE